MSFRIFQNEKTPFYAIKTRSSKSPKIYIFSKKLTHGFGLKMTLFRTFLRGAIQARKISFTIFYIKKTPLQPIKTTSSKRQKIDIFPTGLTHGFGPKMDNFPIFFFKAIDARNMSFMIFKNEKRLLQAIKTRILKSRKIDFFAEGLNHGFGLKMALFSTFFLCNIGQENLFYGILERKNPFLGYKKKVQKVEKLTFFQRG